MGNPSILISVLMFDHEAGAGEDGGPEGIATYRPASLRPLILSRPSIVLLFTEGQTTESASVWRRGHAVRTVALSLTRANCLTEDGFFF